MVYFQLKVSCFQNSVMASKMWELFHLCCKSVYHHTMYGDSLHSLGNLRKQKDISGMGNLLKLFQVLFSLLARVINIIQFLHARPWIPGDEKSIFTVVIHYWRSPLRQFARARTIGEYDITMLVYPVRVSSQINCSDVTMPRQKRPSLTTISIWAIDDCF